MRAPAELGSARVTGRRHGCTGAAAALPKKTIDAL